MSGRRDISVLVRPSSYHADNILSGVPLPLDKLCFSRLGSVVS